MTFKLNKLAAVVGVALGVLAVPSAFAAAEGMAQAVRQLSNFGLYNYNGGGVATILNAQTDFSSFFATDDASVSATLNSVNQQRSVLSAPPSPPTNLQKVCVGTCGFVEDDFSKHAIPTTATFARADHQLTGVLVAGIQKLPSGTEPTPSTSSLLAEVQIQGSGSGTSNTTSGTGGSVKFTAANNNLQVLIDFNAYNYLYAYVNPAVGGRASSSLSFKLYDSTDNVDVFAWAPDGRAGGISGVGAFAELADPCNLNTGLNANPLSQGPNFLECGVQSVGGFGGLNFKAVTGALTAGHTYDLTFSETTTANMTVIPEPGSLLLVGAALVGLGFVRRRTASAV